MRAYGGLWGQSPCVEQKLKPFLKSTQPLGYWLNHGVKPPHHGFGSTRGLCPRKPPFCSTFSKSGFSKGGRFSKRICILDDNTVLDK